MLGYDGNRFFVSDLPRGNRMGDARALCAHAGDRLRAQVFFFQVTVRHLLLLPGLHFVLERIFQWPLHSGERSPHLLGRLCVGVQDEIGPRHGIIDEYERLRLSRGRQGPDCSHRHFLPETSLAIPKKVRLGLSRDMVSVRESLRRLRNRDRAERHAGHDLSAMHSLETQ